MSKASRERYSIRQAHAILKGRARAVVLAQVVERDGPNCFWCGVETSAQFRYLLKIKGLCGEEARNRYLAMTLDHIVPVKSGGPDTAENGLCACYGCNLKRGNMDASVFLFALIQRDRPRRGTETDVGSFTVLTPMGASPS